MNVSYRDSIYPNKVPMCHWGTYFFIFIVFLFATPTNFSIRNNVYTMEEITDIYTAVEDIEKGNIIRRIALFSLGLMALFYLITSKPTTIRINGFIGIITIFYIVISILSVYWAEDPGLTLRRVTMLILLMLGAISIAERLSIREILHLTVFITSFNLIIGILVAIFIGTFSLFESSWRFAGLLSPVEQGWNCGLLVMSSVVLFILSTKNRSLYLLPATIGIITLLLTKSRVAFFSTVISVFLIMVLQLPKKNKIILFFIIGTIVYISLGYFTIGNKFNMNEIDIILSFGRGQEGKESLTSFSNRIPLWTTCIEFALKKPILGYGYNSFFNTQNMILITQSHGWIPRHAHSGYLEILLNLGFIGLITMVSIILLVFKRSLVLRKINPMYTFMTAFLVWLIINLFTESGLIQRSIFPTFLFLILISKIAFKKGEQQSLMKLK